MKKNNNKITLQTIIIIKNNGKIKMNYTNQPV